VFGRHANILLACAAMLLALPAAAGARSPRPADPLIAAVGDIACHPKQAHTAGECQQADTARVAARLHPTAVLALGDNQYNIGSLEEFLGPGGFNETWGFLKPIMHPVTGNHEYDTTHDGAGFYEYFGALAGPGHRGYYSYRVGSWHIIALNSNCSDVGCADSEHAMVTTAEVAWLKRDLAHVHHRCILAYWHHPLFTSYHRLDHDMGAAPLWRLLLAGRADVVLNGHAHVYERFVPQNIAGRPTALGIREFVVGTGGEKHNIFDGRPLPNTRMRDDRDYGVLFMRLHRNSYAWQFRTVANRIIDRGSATCHA
jgi:hypothetical protein